jgi:hypothetical protein
MQEWEEVARKRAKEQLDRDAKQRCEAAATLIRDQNQEGGWNNAFKDFLWYFIRVKAGIIKGPTLTKKPKQVWQPDINGSYSLQAIDTLVNDVYCVSPFNFYPSRGMKTVNDGDIIEVHELTRQALSDLIGVPGYSDTELKIVLAKLHKGNLKARWLQIDDETLIQQVEKEKNLSSAPSTAQTFQEHI